ncbi:hypothetical protein HZB60_09415 [candidate division KSB1 bacterium]|nr:hypothetical protein [candidate division KSB1 bacterium]
MIEYDGTITLGEIATAFTTLTAVGFALFHEAMIGRLFGPRLRVICEAVSPYVQDFSVIDSQPLFEGKSRVAYRIKLENRGKRAANNVRVYVSKIDQVVDGQASILAPWVPVELVWTHTESGVQESIPSRHACYVNLGYAHYRLANMSKLPDFVQNNRRVGSADIGFEFCTMVQPADGYNVVGPGKYIVHLVVTAGNAKTFTKRVTLAVELVMDRLNRTTSPLVEIMARPVEVAILRD